MAKVKKLTQKQKLEKQTARLNQKKEGIRLKKVVKDAAHLHQLAYHQAAHYLVAETLKRGEVLAHLEVERQKDRLNVSGEQWITNAEAPSLPMLLSAVGWAGVLSLPFTTHNIKNLDDWFFVQNDSAKQDLAALASDDSEKLAKALKGAAVKAHAGPKDIEAASMFADHAKSVLYAVWILVKSRAKLKNMAQQLIATGATYPKYKNKEWEKLVGEDVIEAALAIKTARL